MVDHKNKVGEVYNGYEELNASSYTSTDVLIREEAKYLAQSLFGNEYETTDPVAYHFFDLNGNLDSQKGLLNKLSALEQQNQKLKNEFHSLNKQLNKLTEFIVSNVDDIELSELNFALKSSIKKQEVQLNEHITNIKEELTLALDKKLQLQNELYDELNSNFEMLKQHVLDNKVENASLSSDQVDDLIGQNASIKAHFFEEFENLKKHVDTLEENLYHISNSWLENEKVLNELQLVLNDFLAKKNNNDDELFSLFKTLKLRADHTEEKLKNLETFRSELVEFEQKIKELKDFDVNKHLDPVLVTNLVLDSAIFQKALENKINILIHSNNDFLGTEFKGRIDSLSNQFADKYLYLKNEVIEANSNQITLTEKFDYLKGEFLAFAQRNDLEQNILFVQNRFKDLMQTQNKALVSTIEEIERSLSLIQANEKEIGDVVETSPYIENLIRSKIDSVLTSEFGFLRNEIELATSNLEKKLKDISNDTTKQVVDNHIQNQANKIQDKVLQQLYIELNDFKQHNQTVAEQTFKNAKDIDQIFSSLNVIQNIWGKQGLTKGFDDFVNQNYEDLNFDEKLALIKEEIIQWKNELTSRTIDQIKEDVTGEMKNQAYINFGPYVPPYGIEQQQKAADESFFSNRIKDILNELEKNK